MLSEYSPFRAVTRARATFFQRRARVLLYSERAHFYNRYRIRGIQVRLHARVGRGAAAFRSVTGRPRLLLHCRPLLPTPR